MHDILIALAFVGMVVAPAVVAAIPGNEQEEEAKDESNGFRTLSQALANAKRVMPAAAETHAVANR